MTPRPATMPPVRPRLAPAPTTALGVGRPAPGRVRAGALLGGLALGVLAFAPAQWLALGVEHATGGRLRLANAQGTVWRGEADWLLSGGRGSTGALALPQGLRWRLAPTWGEHGPALQLALQAPCCAPTPWLWQFQWQPGGPSLVLAAHRSQWPATWLAGLGTPWNTLQLDGQLRLDTPGLRLRWTQGQPRFEGELRLQAQDLSTRLSTLQPLGSYEWRLAAGTDHAPQLQLTTLRGDLRLSGEGQWSGGRFRFRGLAEAQADSVDALSNLLNILGRRDGARAHMSLG